MENLVLPVDILAYQHPWRRLNTGAKGAFVLSWLLLSQIITGQILGIWTLMSLLVGFWCAGAVGPWGLKTYRACVGAILAFLSISTVLMGVSISWAKVGVSLSLNLQALATAGLWLMRGLGGGSMLMAFALCTPMTETIALLSKLKVPTLLLDLMVVGYRFLGVMLAESAALSKSQRLRLSHRTKGVHLQSTAGLIGLLFSRVAIKAQRYQLARQLRLECMEDINDDATD